MKKIPEFISLSNGNKATISKNHIFIALDNKLNEEMQANFLSANNLNIVSKEKKTVTIETQNIEIPNAGDNYFFAESPKDINLGINLNKINDLRGGYFIAPVYFIDKNNKNTWFAAKQNSIILNIESGSSIDRLKKILSEHKIFLNDIKTQYLNGQYYFDINANSNFNSFGLSEYLLNDFKGEVTSIDFEFIPYLKPLCGITPNDILYSNQWNLNKIEWHVDHLKCNKDVIIAVIDEGCDLNHPDINYISLGINLATMLPTGVPTGNHGTPCAGIAAGITNNSEGISGVSGKSKILPLAVQYWSAIEIANGLNYAAQFGASVVSMSFGVYDNWGFWNYNIINPAIVAAHKRGVFLCAATGNENLATNNRYPAKHPLVVAVGGSNKDDKRKHIGDTSVEPWWGACYGLELFQNSWVGVSVVAPCLQIPATDRSGAVGYNPGNYTLTFNGTSSSTPQVAGLAALIKAKFPKLSNIDIQKIIEQSADKVGGYIFTTDIRFPNSSWTKEIGHGRINVRKALFLAEQLFGGCNNCCDC